MNLSSSTTKHKSFQAQHSTYFPFYKINLSKPEPFTSKYKRNFKDLFYKTQKLLSFGNNLSLSYNFNLRRSWLNLPTRSLTRNNSRLKEDKKSQSYKFINTRPSFHYQLFLINPIPINILLSVVKTIILPVSLKHKASLSNIMYRHRQIVSQFHRKLLNCL